MFFANAKGRSYFVAFVEYLLHLLHDLFCKDDSTTLLNYNYTVRAQIGSFGLVGESLKEDYVALMKHAPSR